MTEPMPYTPKNSHLVTYLGAAGTLAFASAAVAFWPVTIIGAVAGVVAANRSEKAKAAFGRMGSQAGELGLDFVHFAVQDLTVVRDGCIKLFSKKEKPEEEAVERPAEKKLTAAPDAAAGFNAGAAPRQAVDYAPIPLAEPSGNAFALPRGEQPRP